MFCGFSSGIAAALPLCMDEPATRRSLLIDDAAVLLGVSRRTVYYRIREGELETVRTRCGSQRVLLSSIERMLRRDRGLPPIEAVTSGS
jgi:excisionase family DNA binding protein